MNTYLKSIGLIFITLITFTNCKEQNVEKEEEIVAVDVSVEKEAVAAVMKNYKDAVQNLTTEGTKELFTNEATVFESGGSEGTYENYESHHLGPELKTFDSFTFSDYKIDVKIDLPYAFTTETYIFTIGLKANEEKGREARIIKKKGVATSDLKKVDGQWKITKTHSSSRDIRKVSH
ncbi:Cif family virulence factor [Changchengzhania lutea]|uniref:nuclear transport factor 2 family protein n=1 Tax=Changchengzhania lutea TaxID=2049305 RepID=UPI00115F121B|nr:nuclear transport factor 2 family protein [Changchengzhania lutea]